MPVFSKNENAFLYIHIPKCAGSSVLSMMGDLSDKTALYYQNEWHDFPCNPQHFQQSLLQNLCAKQDIDNSIAIVRNPLMRLISEHLYRNALRKKSNQKTKNFAQDIFHYFKTYKHNNYIYDNHIRPQIEFIFPQTKVFRLETQYPQALKAMFQALNENPLHTNNFTTEKKNASPKQEFILSKKEIDSIQHFYHCDYEMFGYQKLALSPQEKLSFSELKQALLSQKPALIENQYCYNHTLVESYFANKKQSRYGKIRQKARRILTLSLG